MFRALLIITLLTSSLCHAQGDDYATALPDSMKGRGVKHQLAVGLANPILGFTSYSSLNSGGPSIRMNLIPYFEYKRFWDTWALRASFNFNGVIQENQENLVRVFGLVGGEKRWLFPKMDVFLGLDLMIPYSHNDDLLGGRSEWQSGASLCPIAGMEFFLNRYISLSFEMGGGYGFFMARHKQWGVSNGNLEFSSSWVLTRVGALGLHINI